MGTGNKGIEYKRFISRDGEPFIAMDLESYVRDCIRNHA